MDILAKNVSDDPLEAFKTAVSNIQPKMEVKSRRVGGSTYQVPIEVAPNRRSALAMRWLISYSMSKKGNTI